MFLRAKTIALYNKQYWAGYSIMAKDYLQKYGAHISEQEKAAFQQAIDLHK